MREQLKAISLFFVNLFVIVAGAIAAMFMFESVRPAWLDLRREGNQRSQQYVQTTQDRLYQLKRKYDDLGVDIARFSDDQSNTQVVSGMVARQKSLVDEMQQEAESIPLSEVPQSIKSFLVNQGRL